MGTLGMKHTIAVISVVMTTTLLALPSVSGKGQSRFLAPAGTTALNSNSVVAEADIAESVFRTFQAWVELDGETDIRKLLDTHFSYFETDGIMRYFVPGRGHRRQLADIIRPDLVKLWNIPEARQQIDDAREKILGLADKLTPPPRHNTVIRDLLNGYSVGDIARTHGIEQLTCAQIKMSFLNQLRTLPVRLVMTISCPVPAASTVMQESP